MGGPTVPKTLQKAAGQEELELVKVEQVEVGPGCVYTWQTYQLQAKKQEGAEERGHSPGKR